MLYAISQIRILNIMLFATFYIFYNSMIVITKTITIITINQQFTTFHKKAKLLQGVKCFYMLAKSIIKPIMFICNHADKQILNYNHNSEIHDNGLSKKPQAHQSWPPIYTLSTSINTTPDIMKKTVHTQKHT